MAKSKASVQFEADTSGFTQGIKEADKSLTTLRKELKLNSAELQENAEDVDLLNKRKNILQQEADETSKKIENLKNKLESAKSSFGENSKEVYQLQNKIIDTQTAFQKIQNEITQTDSKLANLENGLNETETEMKQVDDATDQLADSFGITEVAIGNLVANGIQELSGSLKDLIVDSDTAMSNFQAQTGLSAEAMQEFEDVIEETYSKNFGESINDIANAMSQVKQQTKETDPTNLQKMTENALMLRDTFDFDVAESMRAVNSLMNQFGVDSDTAFNLVVQGAQKGLNANGDMMDVINEYSVQFANMGVSADEMFNMLVNGAETGTWSIDKMGDSMKEFNIRMSDGTVQEALEEQGIKIDDLSSRYAKGGETSKKAMSEVINSIMDVEDETERYKLGVSVFGTMWEDLGEDAIASLFNTKGSIDSTKQSMQELTQIKMDNITTQIGEIGRMIQNDFIIPIAEQLLPPLKEGLEWIGDNLNWLLPIVTGLGIAFATYFAVTKIMGVVKVFTTMFTLVKSGTTIFGALNTVMALNPIALVVAAIVGLIAIFVLLWNKCDGFREFWINLWNKIKSFGASAIDGIKNSFNKFKNSVGELKDNIVGKFNDMKSKVTNTFNNVKTAISNPIEKAKETVRKAVNKIKGYFDFDWSLPKPKIPKFKVSGGEAPWGFMGKGKLPSVSIKWNAEGVIFKKPAILNSNQGLQGVGEAGAEAILPIEKLENWMNRGFNNIVNNNYYASEKIDRLIELTEGILNKSNDTYLNGRKVSEELAPSNDSVSGQRVNLKTRGLIL